MANISTMESLKERFDYYFDWTYAGVDHEVFEGTGGQACVDFIPYRQKIIETTFIVTMSLLQIVFAYKRLKMPTQIPPAENRDRTGKKVMLVVMCLTFGCEIGFKFATKQMIWILNPCHMVTAVQIFLLAAPPNKFTMAVFRLHMHALSGASIALLFPVVNTRLLPFETEVYYLQHVLMLVVPFYLIRVGGVYTPEPLTDFTWPIMAEGVLYFYHWTFMQALAIFVQVNLNNMLCPALSDPFYGLYYRMMASLHQTLCIMFHGKTYAFLAQLVLPRRPRVPETYIMREDDKGAAGAGVGTATGGRLSNGHAKTK